VEEKNLMPNNTNYQPTANSNPNFNFLAALLNLRAQNNNLIDPDA
jgi:hypothetical protein